MITILVIILIHTHTQKKEIIPEGVRKWPAWLFTKEKKKEGIYCFLNLFSVPYLCLHVDDPPCSSLCKLLSDFANLVSKGSAPSESGMT